MLRFVSPFSIREAATSAQAGLMIGERDDLYAALCSSNQAIMRACSCVKMKALVRW
jgi:hypothetical protein